MSRRTLDLNKSHISEKNFEFLYESSDALMIYAALDGFGYSLTVNPTSYTSVIRPVLAAMKRAIHQDIYSQRQKTAASKFDAILAAKGAAKLI